MYSPYFVLSPGLTSAEALNEGGDCASRYTVNSTPLVARVIKAPRIIFIPIAHSPCPDLELNSIENELAYTRLTIPVSAVWVNPAGIEAAQIVQSLSVVGM